MLKPGGRFAVSDVVVRGAARPAACAERRAVGRLRRRRAGGGDYRPLLLAAGFDDVEIVPTTDYREKYGQEIEQAVGKSLPADVNLVGAFIRATKPGL